jgi:4-hydroxybenzoate polyprenyltransferase
VSAVSAPVHRPPSALRSLVGASRPLSWVNTAYPFAAAYYLSGGGVDLALVLGTVYFLIPYNLLMYGINDVFDYESDLRNARKGGVEGVVLDTRLHRLTIWAAVLSNLPFLVALLVLGSVASAAILAVVTFAVVAYSAPGLRFKERPFLDSVTSSTHFVGPAVFGLALADGSFDRTALAALGAFFLWGMASQAFGAVQDIGPDREAGIGSVGTVLGAAATVRLAIGLYAAGGLVVLGTGWMLRT